jgi:hypothetical protein
MKRLTTVAKQLLRRWGYDIVARGTEKELPVDFDERDTQIIRAVQPYTMTGPERLYALIKAVEYVVNNRVEGAIVECGVWKGGSMMAVALTLARLNSHRHLYLFDTYEGMTRPGEHDVSSWGKRASEAFEGLRINDGSSRWSNAPLEDVKTAMASTGYDSAFVHYVKGRVEDTIPREAPQAVSLLRLDTDWYESTRHELTHLFPRLACGGVLIVDDYGHWLGARKAVDEYVAHEKLCILLNRIDYTGRIGVKLHPLAAP